MERFGDERLADVRAIGIGSVDEVDAELDRSTQHGLCLFAIRWLAPDAGTGDPHRAEAEAVDGDVASDLDRSRGAGRRVRLLTHGKFQTLLGTSAG